MGEGGDGRMEGRRGKSWGSLREKKWRERFQERKKGERKRGEAVKGKGG